MQILNVATESTKINMNTQKATFNLHTTLPKISIHTEAAKLEIRQPKGDLQIDSTAFRSSYGIKSLQAFCQDNARESKSIGLGAIGSIVEDGNRMAQIGSQEDAIAAMAAESSFSNAGELTWAPLAKPEIHYKANQPQIRFIDGKINLNFERGKVEAEYQRGKVNVDIAQYPSIRRWTSDNKVDLML